VAKRPDACLSAHPSSGARGYLRRPADSPHRWYEFSKRSPRETPAIAWRLAAATDRRLCNCGSANPCLPQCPELTCTDYLVPFAGRESLALQIALVHVRAVSIVQPSLVG